MLRKLLKYELKATARKFMPLYGAMLVASVLVNFGVRFFQNNIFFAIIIFVLVSLFITLGVVTLMTMIQRFKNNLLSDEGYLMFTLPVSTEKLILSKLITTFIWALLSGIISILSFLVIFANKEVITQAIDFINNYSYFLELIQAEHIILAIIVIICSIFQFLYFVLLVYTSLSVAQMAIFNKRRGLVSFIAFMVISIIVSVIIQTIFGNIFGSLTLSNVQDAIMVFSTALLVNLSLTVIMFFATDYLLKNHLNIE